MITKLRWLLAKLPLIGKYIHPYVGQIMWITIAGQEREQAIIKTFDCCTDTATVDNLGETGSNITITF